ncbi:hypothetical protein BJV82DRAFT_576176 [Fennellomyces sp. T-0311]|nr:hypothetical protein BJV82DRAFT_576176 [Fennellomyces sp. T-0311]
MADEFDIYGDDTFGSEIQETKASRIDHRSSSQPASRQSAPSTTTNYPVAETKAEHGQRQQTPQKIPSSVQSYSSSTRSTTDSPSSTSSRRELPISMSNLRGIVPHPTNAMYIGELAWYVNDEAVKAPLVEAGLGNELKDLTFFEHKVNGKSRGEIDGKITNVSFTSSSNPFKHTPKEPVPKSQRVSQQRDVRMGGSQPQMMGGGFNPMMGGGFNPMMGNMGMNPYGGFNPMAAAAARGGFFDNMMGMPGGGGRGGRGAVRGAGQPQYMGRMGGRGNAMMGGGNMSGNGGMYINPAFFDQQQQQGGAGHNA